MKQSEDSEWHDLVLYTKEWPHLDLALVLEQTALIDTSASIPRHDPKKPKSHPESDPLWPNAQ